MYRVLLCALLLVSDPVIPQSAPVSSALRIGRVKYSGGGDWYNDPSSEVNLLRYVQEETGIRTDPGYFPIDLTSEELFTFPVLFLTGHGNIKLAEAEARNLRRYLENGGFLYVDDDYGLDGALRKSLQHIFPDRELVELPLDHPIYTIHFSFPDGPPKIHEHDGKAPQGFGLFIGTRLVLYYTYESNPGDGWADPQIHNDSEAVRREALRFGCNILVWALSN